MKRKNKQLTVILQEVKPVENVIKTDNAKLEQVEGKTETAQIVTKNVTKAADAQAKAPESNPDVEKVQPTVDNNEKKEEPIKETVLVAEINVPKEDQQKEIPSESTVATEVLSAVIEVKNAQNIPDTEEKVVVSAPSTEVKENEIKPKESTSVNAGSMTDEAKLKEVRVCHFIFLLEILLKVIVGWLKKKSLKNWINDSLLKVCFSGKIFVKLYQYQ